MMEKQRNARWEMMDKGNFELAVLRQHFEVHNRTEGKSPRTVQWYNEVLGMFTTWLEDNDLATTLGSIGEFNVRQFILHVQQMPGRKSEHLSTHSVANRVRALRAFFSWVAAQGYSEENLLKHVKSPKTTDQIIEPLTENEFVQAFSAINPNTALGARNTAVVSLMLDTGVRLSEVSSLKERDVHLEERYVKVLGKGSKERIVAFGVACQRSLLHYVHHFRVQPAHPQVNGFFLTIDGYPLSSYGVQSLIARLAKSSGVIRLHPHLLRHTYATSFLLNGGGCKRRREIGSSASLVKVLYYS